MDSFEIEMKVSFLDEARELLANSEQCFLDLEKAKNDPSIIEQIFRLAHNLKGSAGAVGFLELGEFTHTLESLLLKIKNHEIEVDGGIISLLLECNDFLIVVIDGLKEDLEYSQRNPELQDKLKARIAAGASGAADDHETAHPEPDTEEDNAAGSAREDRSIEDILLEETMKEQQLLHAQLNPAPEPTTNTYAAAVAIESDADPAVATEEKKAKKSTGDENIRVSLGKIDELLNNVGELVILQTVMEQQKQNVLVPIVQKTVDRMTKIIKEIQSTSMGLRMLPVKLTFQKMQRIVRDTSTSLGKKANIYLQGEETELDKTVLEQLSDPLVHIIRNAVDHGLESPEERALAGKDEAGSIWLSAYHRGGQIVIEIREDGRGLDPDKLIARAKSKGVIKATDNLTPEQAYQLIFAPGFSTKEQVTDVSGRGVGMDVVKTNVQALQGEIELETKLGHGTCIRIILPLTLAIVDGMVLALNEERFVIPISQVVESLRPLKADVSTVSQSSHVLNLRGETLPIYYLETLLNRKIVRQKPIWDGILLVLKDNQRRSFAVFVDDIICQQQVVIKKLGHEIRGTPGFTGAAILGDGRVSLILDFMELAQAFHNKINKNKNKEKTEIKRPQLQEAS